jgi:hypothetical protein
MHQANMCFNIKNFACAAVNDIGYTALKIEEIVATMNRSLIMFECGTIFDIASHNWRPLCDTTVLTEFVPVQMQVDAGEGKVEDTSQLKTLVEMLEQRQVELGSTPPHLTKQLAVQMAIGNAPPLARSHSHGGGKWNVRDFNTIRIPGAPSFSS